MKLLTYFLTLFLGVFLNTSFAQTLTQIPNPKINYNDNQGYEQPLFIDNELLYLNYTDGIYVYDEIELKKVPNQPTSFYGFFGSLNDIYYLNFGGKIYAFDGINFTLVSGQDSFSIFGGLIINNFLYLICSKNDVRTLYQFDGISFLEIPNPPNHTKTTFYGLWGYVGSLNNKHFLLYRDDDNLWQWYEIDGLNLFPVPLTGDGFNNNGSGLAYSCCFLNYNNLISFVGNPDHIYSYHSLSFFDGTEFSYVLSPPGYRSYSGGYKGAPILLNDNLYLMYQNEVDHRINRLFKYDGTTLTQVYIDSEIRDWYNGGYNLVFNGRVYLSFYNSLLYEFDGASLTKIPNPTDFTYNMINPIVYKNKLFLRYRKSKLNTKSTKHLFVYDPNALSTSEESLSNISVFPNPTKDKVTVSIGKHTKHSIQLFNLLGELVFETTSNTQETTFELPESSGVYFIKITGEELNYSTKILKE
jgi:hypothetical protein